jgi:ABC-type spermidine/putrescine transport system permease subunit I
MASAVAIVMTLLILAPMAWFNRIHAVENEGAKT